MAFQLTQAVIDDDQSKLSLAEWAVLVVLSRHADEAGQNCFPSLDTIVKKTHACVDTVRDAIKGLVAKGRISYTQAPGKKRQYTIITKGWGEEVGEIQGVGKSAPVGEIQGGEVGEITPHPLEISTPTPGKSHTRRDQLKDQEKKEVVVPVPAHEESALHPTIDDFGIPAAAAKDKATSTEAPKPVNPPKPRPLQGPSYIDPVPFDEIVAAYNRHMAHIGGKVRALEPAQTDAVVAFWECLVIELWETKDDELRTRAGALEQVDHYFRHCAQDGFINGTAKRKEEYKGWIAKFDWLIRESTLRRMLGGGYAPSGAGKKEGR